MAKAYRYMTAQERLDSGENPVTAIVGGAAGSVANGVLGDKNGKMWELTPEEQNQSFTQKVSDDFAGQIGKPTGSLKTPIPGINFSPNNSQSDIRARAVTDAQAATNAIAKAKLPPIKTVPANTPGQALNLPTAPAIQPITAQTASPYKGKVLFNATAGMDATGVTRPSTTVASGNLSQGVERKNARGVLANGIKGNNVDDAASIVNGIQQGGSTTDITNTRVSPIAAIHGPLNQAAATAIHDRVDFSPGSKNNPLPISSPAKGAFNDNGVTGVDLGPSRVAGTAIDAAREAIRQRLGYVPLDYEQNPAKYDAAFIATNANDKNAETNRVKGIADVGKTQMETQLMPEKVKSDVALQNAHVNYYNAEAQLKQAMSSPDYLNRQLKIAEMKDKAAAQKEQDKEDRSLVNGWLKGVIGAEPSPDELALGMGYLKDRERFSRGFDTFIERLPPNARQRWIDGFKNNDPTIVAQLQQRGIIKPAFPTFKARTPIEGA